MPEVSAFYMPFAVRGEAVGLGRSELNQFLFFTAWPISGIDHGNWP